MFHTVFVLLAWAEISQKSLGIDDGSFVINCFFQQHPDGLGKSSILQNFDWMSCVLHRAFSSRDFFLMFILAPPVEPSKVLETIATL